MKRIISLALVLMMALVRSAVQAPAVVPKLL